MNGWIIAALAIIAVQGAVIAYLARLLHTFSDMALARTSQYMRSIQQAETDAANNTPSPSWLAPTSRPLRHSAPISLPLNCPTVNLPDREEYRQ